MDSSPNGSSAGSGLEALHELLAEVRRLLAEHRAADTFDELLTVPEAAVLAKMSESAVYQAIERGEFPGVRRIGPRTIRISKRELLHGPTRASSLPRRGK
jgi:excisionase family DNA binding protein